MIKSMHVHFIYIESICFIYEQKLNSVWLHLLDKQVLRETNTKLNVYTSQVSV